MFLKMIHVISKSCLIGFRFAMFSGITGENLVILTPGPVHEPPQATQNPLKHCTKNHKQPKASESHQRPALGQPPIPKSRKPKAQEAIQTPKAKKPSKATKQQNPRNHQSQEASQTQSRPSSSQKPTATKAKAKANQRETKNNLQKNQSFIYIY